MAEDVCNTEVVEMDPIYEPLVWENNQFIDPLTKQPVTPSFTVDTTREECRQLFIEFESFWGRGKIKYITHQQSEINLKRFPRQHAFWSLYNKRSKVWIKLFKEGEPQDVELALEEIKSARKNFSDLMHA